ncbi:MAG: phosphoglycerate mutase family protein [Clostridiales bacterium]|nr:phosphoglycerate mutase family protein [Clostridiales bacterium]
MKKTLYLMRHGQTLFNVQHKIQGWCDAPLTELGIRQCEIAGQYFTDHQIAFDHAYSSTSERACDTLEIVTGGKMLYTRLKGLKEWNFGVFEGKDECLNPQLPYGDFFKQFGGEGEMELRERVNQTLTEVMSREDHQIVLAVSHGAACAGFARRWESRNKVQYQRGVKNCAIFRYEYEDGQFSLQEIINHDFSGIM